MVDLYYHHNYDNDDDNLFAVVVAVVVVNTSLHCDHTLLGYDVLIYGFDFVIRQSQHSLIG